MGSGRWQKLGEGAEPASTRLDALLVEHDQPVGGGVRKNLKLGEGAEPPPAVRREEITVIEFYFINDKKTFKTTYPVPVSLYNTAGETPRGDKVEKVQQVEAYGRNT